MKRTAIILTGLAFAAPAAAHPLSTHRARQLIHHYLAAPGVSRIAAKRCRAQVWEGSATVRCDVRWQQRAATGGVFGPGVADVRSFARVRLGPHGGPQCNLADFGWGECRNAKPFAGF